MPVPPLSYARPWERSEALAAKHAEEAEAAEQLQELAAAEASASTELDAVERSRSELQSEAERLRDTVDAEAQLAVDDSRSVETLASKQAALRQRKTDFEKKIRDLGSLPADAFEKYRAKNAKVRARLATAMLSG